MKLSVLLLCLLRATKLESKVQIWSYRGESVTLASGGDPTWSLQEIRWFIYINDTVIASYYRGQTRLRQFHLYTGRLDLNITSGDLTIRNLTLKDSLDYNVELIDTGGKIMEATLALRVRERLLPPAIQKVFSSSENGSCWVALSCWHPDRGVKLTWSVLPSVSIYNWSGPDSRLGLVVHLRMDLLPVRLLTCSASKTAELSASVRAVELHCGDDPPDPRGHPGLLPFLGLTLGVLLSFAFFTWQMRGRLPLRGGEEDTRSN